MKSIKIFMVLLMVCMVWVLSPGCLQEPEKKPSMTTPAATVSPVISGTSPAATQVETVKTQSKYIVLIDDYGFNKVIETTNKNVDYVNYTLNINMGDTVEWKNDAVYNDILTLVSDQELWAPGDLKTKLINKPLNYTFTKPGTYTFRIKEETRYIQTIIVHP